MDILYFLLFGLVVGAIARLLVPGRESGGWITSIAIGVLGAFAGGFIGRGLGWYGAGQPAGFVLSLLGAVVLLIGYHAVARRSVA
jgi:uncharacterized membrane protein YeaQ/YmgE (transglycosylase-associated protein family)